MVGDTCSPITLISGDTNADARLDVNETWVYTCSTILTKTHTNIITATGWANGISASDIANATVVVGIPVVPPLIHVTKVPNTLVLSAGGGMVTYTNKVTNPGTVALSNVYLTDDKCGPVKYISGDMNGNSKLDTTETWVYTCQSTLAKTTVNTITASGEANGLTNKDFAIATVVVAATRTLAVPVSVVPKLPDTGVHQGEKSIPWNIIVPTSIFAMLTLFYVVRRKQTA
ncbi:MAG: Conserved repeat domain protein [Candidatus Magasanikbacteria bacterium GW2011_GWE2_42_7]|uniref:Conserved repeat domain protein n=1 Tax=Candidatus Magasanikbacteria bacterium GW2011_GWE2_42_7 TaxID=1619052 RepID=A0A0G1BE03_9BACT|nr:MAG: Conserved repeat domain protein [Candidatus Magasanikbacteria bacterium GW2011_GWE2_42_7]